jgi:6-phosphofructokinase 1
LPFHGDSYEAGCPFPTRTLILGHLQRGGSPAPADRILASRLGDFAVRSILADHSGAMAGLVQGKLLLTPFRDTYAHHKPVPEELVKLLETLAS